MVSKSIEPKTKKTPAIPNAKPKSPILLTTNAFIAALLAEAL